jgi:protein TonB
MFEDSLLESGNRFKKGQQTASTVFSFVIQAIFVGIAVLIPLIYTDALPSTQLMTFLVAPPPPPPPPPPPAAEAVKVVRAVSEMVNGQLRTPTAIPKKVEMIKEEEAPPAMSSLAGVVGGTGTGGSLGGVMGGIIGGAANVVVPKAAPVQRIRVSQGVSEGLLLHKVTPNYPPLARQARIQGSVILAAVISKTGTIENLHLQSGHPMLAPAAIEAVKQWKYKPYFLNGEPVEVETVITVNFTLAGG